MQAGLEHLAGAVVPAPVRPDAVVLCWLSAELHSSRFGGALREALAARGATEALLTCADLDDGEENALRRSVLHRYREWFDVDVDAVSWVSVALDAQAAGQLRYLDYSYWNELSRGTGFVRHGADAVRRGTVVFGVSNQPFLDVARAVADGVTLPPVIALRRPDERALQLVEGHVRATGYVLARSRPGPLAVIEGLLPRPQPSTGR